MTALTGVIAGIDPFDQPGVEESKIITRALMGAEGSEGKAERFRAAMGRRVPAEIRLRGKTTGARRGGAEKRG